VNLKQTVTVLVTLLATFASASSQTAAPLKVGIVGLVHGHVAGFFGGGALTPAGGILNRPDVQLVGIVEPDQALFDSYAQRFHLSPALHFRSLAEMVARVHPQAALVFTAPDQHRAIVEECASLGVSVLMEKPLAITYGDALAMQAAAARSHIHVLVDFETSWYASNSEAYKLVADNKLGPIVKTVIRDGHQGPKEIGVGPEFLAFLTDPKRGGDGALIDFGCYGPDLMTWLMHGEAPQSVTAVTRQVKPEVYPRVDDEADILLTYPHAVAIVEASWSWPFALKQMDVYGRAGYAKAIDSTQIEVRKKDEAEGHLTHGQPLAAPYDDPLHYLEAVLSGQIQEGDSLSSLKTNVIVTEILDAAHQSALTGRAVPLPLR
jgi:predicted dehydrogenase